MKEATHQATINTTQSLTQGRKKHGKTNHTLDESPSLAKKLTLFCQVSLLPENAQTKEAGATLRWSRVTLPRTLRTTKKTTIPSPPQLPALLCYLPTDIRYRTTTERHLLPIFLETNNALQSPSPLRTSTVTFESER